MASFEHAENLKIEHDENPIELGANEDEYDFLLKIVRDPKQPMSRRMRAAIEALPYRRPKLGAVAIGQMSGKDFATLLERAILRSNRGQEVKQIEGSAVLTKAACQNLVR